MGPEGKTGAIETLQGDTAMPKAEDYFRQLILDNLSFIEKQCRKASALTHGNPSRKLGPRDPSDHELQTMHIETAGALDPDTLFNDVLDRLRADNYRTLRNFKRHSKLTTYITTIIANLVVDIVRRAKGRSRTKERAREMGQVGDMVYELVFVRGYPVAQAHEALTTAFDASLSLENIEEMVAEMRGRRPNAPAEEFHNPPESAHTTSLLSRDNSPHEALAEKQKHELTEKALGEVLSELNNEEKLIIKMRFPLGEEEPKTLSEIADTLGTSEKAIDGRIRRILSRCRESMLRHGLSLDDFIDEK